MGLVDEILPLKSMAKNEILGEIKATLRTEGEDRMQSVELAPCAAHSRAARPVRAGEVVRRVLTPKNTVFPIAFENACLQL
jgi:hypothetical protein